MNKKREENNFLYFLEGTACICVIFIHCMFPRRMGILVCGLARFAVPLFFMVSGYYLYQNSLDEKQVRERIKRKSIKIGCMLGASAAFYLVWTLLRMFWIGGSVSVLQCVHKLLQPRQFFSALVLNDFTEIGGHLWFLAALLYCYLILGGVVHIWGIYGLQKALNLKAAALLLSIHLSGRMILSWRGIDNIWGISVYLWFRNWLFMAFPFLAAGFFIHQNQDKILQTLCVKKLFLLFISGVLLTIVESLFVFQRTGDDRELYCPSCNNPNNRCTAGSSRIR